MVFVGLRTGWKL